MLAAFSNAAPAICGVNAAFKTGDQNIETSCTRDHDDRVDHGGGDERRRPTEASINRTRTGNVRRARLFR
ncbi:MAG: hypothetical protein KIT48_05765 [Pseudolabrys sp.]|nr:hypothetical protein [Pseudolabrys sp.]